MKDCEKKLKEKVSKKKDKKQKKKADRVSVSIEKESRN